VCAGVAAGANHTSRRSREQALLAPFVHWAVPVTQARVGLLLEPLAAR
jgi:hypothetical protein